MTASIRPPDEAPGAGPTVGYANAPVCGGMVTPER